jgi:hypothetical protein
MPQLRVLWLATSITTLSLQQTSVTDQGIAGLERMPNLCELVVAHTAVTDVRRFVQRTMPWRLVVDIHTKTTDDQVGIHVFST